MRFGAILCLTTGILLSACATDGYISSPFQSKTPIATRVFVQHKYAPPKGYGAFGVVLFAQAATTAQEVARRETICRAYLAAMPDAIAIKAATPDRPQMVTVWPRVDLTASLTISQNDTQKFSKICEQAVQKYDYAAASNLLTELANTGKINTTRRGPFLAAWAPPDDYIKQHGAILTYDLTNYDQEDDIDEAFQFWKRRIESKPKLWAKGWDLTSWEMQLAAWADHTAPMILASLKLIPAPVGK